MNAVEECISEQPATVAQEPENESLKVKALQDAGAPDPDSLQIKVLQEAAARGELACHIEFLQAEALALWEVDQASALELGHALIAVREAMILEHGAFAKWWREAGMNENRVYYCIRQAEGKVNAPKTDAPAFHLNRRNLAVGKVGPDSDGRFTKRAIHVGKHGTTCTDGFVGVRVSLPPDSPIPQDEGFLSTDVASRLISEGNVSVSFGKTLTTVKGRGKATITFPNEEVPYPPPFDRLLGHKEHVFQCAFRIDILQKLVNAAKEFHSEGDILLTFHGTGLVRGDVSADGQNWLGLAMGLRMSTFRALHDADTVQSVTSEAEETEETVQ